MPLPIYLAHRLAFRLTEVRKSGEVPHLRPDGKTQVTIEYDDDDKPVRLDTVLISTQHDPEVTQDWLAVELKKHVIDPVLDEVLGSKVPHDNYRQLVNPTGSFILGGPAADAGLTGHPLGCEEHRGCRPGPQGRDPNRLRYWRCRPGIRQRGDLRHRARRDARPDRRRRAQGLRPAPRRHHRRAGSETSDLSEDRSFFVSLCPSVLSVSSMSNPPMSTKRFNILVARIRTLNTGNAL